MAFLTLEDFERIRIGDYVELAPTAFMTFNYDRNRIYHHQPLKVLDKKILKYARYRDLPSEPTPFLEVRSWVRKDLTRSYPYNFFTPSLEYINVETRIREHYESNPAHGYIPQRLLNWREALGQKKRETYMKMLPPPPKVKYCGRRTPEEIEKDNRKQEYIETLLSLEGD